MILSSNLNTSLEWRVNIKLKKDLTLINSLLKLQTSSSIIFVVSPKEYLPVYSPHPGRNSCQALTHSLSSSGSLSAAANMVVLPMWLYLISHTARYLPSQHIMFPFVQPGGETFCNSPEHCTNIQSSV